MKRKTTAKKKTATRKTTRKKTPKRARSVRDPRAKRRRKKTPAGKKDLGGRPSIDWNKEAAELVSELASFGNTQDDMAVLLGVSVTSLQTAIADESLPIRAAYYTGLAEMKSGIRKLQVTSANRGNVTMQIWLGKQVLGQRDVKAIELGGEEGGPVKLEADLEPLVKRKLIEFLRSRGKE